MSGTRLLREFFQQDPVKVAKALLGQVLVRKVGGRELAGIVCEVEAYGGSEDRASHAYRGQSARNMAMFDNAGFSYIYQIYGLHWCFNVVVGQPGVAAAGLFWGS